METDLNREISKIIADYFYPKLPIKWLMKNLDISRESAYRRMRATVPFTVEEIFKASRLLNFSLDEIGEQLAPGNGNPEKKDAMIAELDQYLVLLKNNAEGDDISIKIVLNKLELFSVFDLPNVFNFLLFKYAKTSEPNEYTDKSFSEFNPSENAENLRVHIQTNLPINASFEYIISDSLLAGVANDVLYFHKCRQLTEEEARAIKEELLVYINRMERRMTSETDENGNRYCYYLSLLALDNSTLSIETENSAAKTHTSFYSTSENRKNSMDKFVHKFRNLKRYTSPISLLNEPLRMEFLEKQRRAIAVLP